MVDDIYMSLEELPESAYEYLKDTLTYMDEDELRENGLYEERIEAILKGDEPDAQDMEMAFGGIMFVPDDFGFIKDRSDVGYDVELGFDNYISSLQEKYSDGYTEDISRALTDNYKLKDKLIETLTDIFFKYQ